MNASVQKILPEVILFDWDNTLVDSWDRMIGAMNATLAAMGQAPWPVDVAKRRIGPSARELFPQLFGADWPRAEKIFYDAVAEERRKGTHPLPGAQSLLQRLSTAGVPMAVVSNKKSAILREEAKTLGWERYFGALIGSGDAPEDKPSAVPVRMALQQLGMRHRSNSEKKGDEGGGERKREATAVWFVGDNLTDLQCARNSGCFFIHITTSPLSEADWADQPPLYCFPDCSEMEKFLF